MVPNINRSALDLPVLLETEHELIVVKPSGVATELSRDRAGTSLISRVDASLPPDVRPRLPHRLDRVSRGIVVVALTREAIAFHNAQIQERAWEKVYLARCFAPMNRSAEDLIGLQRLHLRVQGGRARVVRSGGKQAMTEILAAASTPDVDGEIHVLVRLHTGRFHQIRATLAHLDMPLVDDWLYGQSPGRERERFYLEHVALRMTPYGEDRLVAVHRRADPDRERIGDALRGALDRLLQAWENEGAVRVGGSDGEERGDQGAGT